MNDNDIIKALECCNSTERGHCLNKCPYYNYSANCTQNMINDALSLINRQKAEIKRLAEENEIKSSKRANIFEIASAYERGKSEAIKEFAEEFENRCIQGGIYPAFIKATLNNLVKEMVGEK